MNAPKAFIKLPKIKFLKLNAIIDLYPKINRRLFGPRNSQETEAEMLHDVEQNLKSRKSFILRIILLLQAQ